MNEADATRYLADRELFVDYLRCQLIGPANGPEEEFGSGETSDLPHERYLMGALFPRHSGNQDLEDRGEDLTAGLDDDEEEAMSFSYQQKPSAMSMSFITSAESIDVDLCGAAYEKSPTDKADTGKKGSRPSLQRRPISNRENPEAQRLSPTSPKAAVLDGRASLLSVWRQTSKGYLVTLTLLNARVAKTAGKVDAADVVHQVWMRCRAPILPYALNDRLGWDEEEEEQALLYRNRPVFGVGHGVSVHWPTGIEQVGSIETEFLPRYEVPPVTADFSPENPLYGDRVFSLAYLADPGISAHDKHERLNFFLENFADWVVGQLDEFRGVGTHRAAASRLANRLEESLARMRKGSQILLNQKIAYECFCMSNLVMLVQMLRSDEDWRNQNGGDVSRCVDHLTITGAEKIRWRPFQLAFQLLTVESVFNQNSTDRDLVDLIWFPTGGGKTEAYLSMAAFEMFRRRKQHGDQGGGTAIIKRYTLRLLTTQQFQRASALICACEQLRKDTPELGDEPFSLGLWVGGDTTPNRFTTSDGKGSYDLLKVLWDAEEPENPFQLQECPWCGTSIVPEQQSEPSEYGVDGSESDFRFNCPNQTCSFHHGIPVQVVDDALYSKPPTFLIGTIDKFARLAWTAEPNAFFNGGQLGARRPPSLIIQDELHLISGPLGTIAGLYEASLDVLLQSADSRPKYIAATATIRRAADQAGKLYARPVSIFPASGTAVEDSYFSREEDEKREEGRLYVGVMGQYHTPVTSLVQTTGAVVQAPQEIDFGGPASDAFWTTVMFHNSRRELGKTMTLCRDDIPARAKVIASAEDNIRESIEPVEMSANISSREIPSVLAQLKQKRGAPGSVDVLPCTNMFSVGVDVQRLGLMIVNGQPKATSEYIQASSRVGRAKGKPGLVIAFYSPTKSRDRSHYETFVSYHQSLYRAVEPTSVTPGALPAMERALHAALIIVMRHAGGLQDASLFDPTEKAHAALINRLKERLLAAVGGDGRSSYDVTQYMDSCVKQWEVLAQKSRAGSTKLVYESRKSQQFESLIQAFLPGLARKPQTPWATLNSMRNVDLECMVRVRGERFN